MKKNLLILAFAAPFAFGQAFYVGDGARVKVKTNTLVHTNGSFKVAEGTGKISNDGNVNVKGEFTGNSDGTRFVNEFTSGTEYGQLIIEGASSGKMTGEYKLLPAAKFAYHPIAFPFKNYKAGEAVSQVGISPTWYPKVRSENRYKSPVFTVENTKSQSVNAAEDDDLMPTDAHSINQLSYAVDNSKVHSFRGIPASGEHPVNFGAFKIEKKNSEFNDYGEFIGGNVVDVTRTAPLGWAQFRTVKGISAGDYGSNMYTLGNPYTSNLDLSKLPNTVEAVIVYKSSVVESNYSDDPNSAIAEVTFKSPHGVIGDNQAIIRPYQVFEVKTTEGNGLSVVFNNDFKTFNTSLKTPTYAYSSARNAQLNSDMSGIYQLGLELYNNDSKTGNRLYVVASDMYEDKGNSKYEAYNLWMGNEDVGFYSLQEKADGTIAEELSDQRVYINGINASDYVAKPVHLVFQGKDDKPYTLKVQENDVLFNSSNKFYFEDKKEGKVIEITPDFEYTFVEPTVNKDRFVIYWNGIPQTMATQDVASSQTQIYKDGVDHKVRFATEFNKADIYIYDLNGRLVSVKKSVDTTSDYTLPYLVKGSVFVVKVVGDNGVVTTHKIIK